MSIAEGCSCSLQARLHQVENARSREMKAHGELVQTLESELESRRISEGELRLAVAKLRTDKCRVEAELGTANARTRQLLEQLDTQRSDHSKRVDEFKLMAEESERRLQDARRKGDQLLEEKLQLNVELSESQKLLGCSRNDIRLLQEKIEEQCLQTNTQAKEIAQLSALVATKQQEIDAWVVRSQLLLEDLSSTRQERTMVQGKLDELDRCLTRAVVTRNRALQWRRRRHDIWDDRRLIIGAFLAWKTLAVQSKLISSTNLVHCNERKRAQLELVEKEILKCCSQAKEDVSGFRLACASERAWMESLRDEICREELPKLLTHLEKLHTSFDRQRQELEAQLTRQQELVRNQEERLDMSRQEMEHRVQILEESHTRQKLQQRAFFQAFAARRSREFQRRTFSAWKEMHLRSLVGQVTHTAMVFQSQQSQASIVDWYSPSKERACQQCATPASNRPVSVPLEPLQLNLQKFDDCLRSPALATPIDAMWRRWRRVDAGVAGRGHKPRPSPNS